MRSIPGLAQWFKDRRHASDLELLWLWCRPVATAPIRPLAWEPPYAAGASLEKAKRQKKKKKKKLNSNSKLLESKDPWWSRLKVRNYDNAGQGHLFCFTCKFWFQRVGVWWYRFYSHQMSSCVEVWKVFVRHEEWGQGTTLKEGHIH